MDELEVKNFVIGDLRDNCYVVFEKKTKQAFIVDCPAPCGEVEEFIKSQGLKVLFIALTHAHFDHIQGLDSNTLPFYLHREDTPLLTDSQLNGSEFFLTTVQVKRKPLLYKDGEPLKFGRHSIDVIHTPGHTPGSVSLKLGSWLFSGDTLFFNSVGRTDVPLASQDALIKSIKEKILTLEPRTVVYPGHGPSTTVGREKESNPFVA